MKRREFIKRGARSATGVSLLAAGAGALTSPGVAAASGKTVVVIFQRGGCDGLNSVVPYADDRYYQLRSSDIAVPAPSIGNSLSALRLTDEFGLNPNLAALRPLWDRGDLAIMPAVGFPDSTLSHFEDQEAIENGHGITQASTDGWLNRYLAGTASDAGLRAVSLDQKLHLALRGDVPVSSIGHLDRFNTGLEGAEDQSLTSDLAPLFDVSNAATPLQRLVQRSGMVGLRDLAVVSQLDIDGYAPANGADYPQSDYGSALRSVAQMLKAGIGVEIATVDIGGWDTHSDQGGAQEDGALSSSQREFSQGVAALYTDLGQLMMENVVIVTMTEFGRTVATNGSGGTDHGVGSVWYVVNNGIRGGMNGGWPGLQDEDLIDQRYLNFTTDYRDVFADIVQNFLATSNVSSILPGHTVRPLNLFT